MSPPQKAAMSSTFECPTAKELPCDSYGLRAYCACDVSTYVRHPEKPWVEYRVARHAGPWINGTSDQIGARPGRTERQ